MSGGHFDYDCFRISQFAEKLAHEIEVNDDESKNENERGLRFGAGFNEDTMAKLRAIQAHIATSGRMAREVEWLYSGDHGEESFCRLVADAMHDTTARKGET